MPEPDKNQDATSAPPAPMGERDVTDVPRTVPGALPENVGHDPGDTHRSLTTARGGHGDVVSLLNRVIMLQQHDLSLVESLRDATPDAAAAARFGSMADEDTRALDVLERAIRDLDGTVNPIRRTGGMLFAKARVLFEDIPARARRAIETRDLEKMREESSFQRVVDYTDAYASALTLNAHWDVLREIGEATGLRGVVDAVNEAADAQRAHADALKQLLPGVVRRALTTTATRAG